MTVLIVLGGLVLALALIQVVRKPSLPLIIIITGGAKNLFDVIVYGQARDPFVLGHLAFNLADILIIFGFLVLLYGIIPK